MNVIDISPVISDRIGVWPGDVPYRRGVSLEMADGANLTLGSMETTLHVGAHTDAPSHYRADGASMESRSLDRYIGPCQVMDVTTPKGERILPEHLVGQVSAPRVLFRTRSYPNPDEFTTNFTSLSPALVDALAPAGCVLVGIDTPSIDPFDDKALESHSAVARHDLGILEGIVLDDVDAGSYVLVALPLRIEAADASPVRAVLLDGLAWPAR